MLCNISHIHHKTLRCGPPDQGSTFNLYPPLYTTISFIVPKTGNSSVQLIVVDRGGPALKWIWNDGGALSSDLLTETPNNSYPQTQVYTRTNNILAPTNTSE